MESKLTVFEKGGKLYADSRNVAEMTGKRHADLCRDIERYINTISTNAKLRSLDFFVESSYIDKKGESRKCYLLTKKGCDMVANKMTGEKGILFTATYINQFYEVEQQLKKQNGLMMPDFNNPAEAARAWADQYDKNHKLLLENTEMKPKAEFYDDVTGSDDTIDIKQVAKVLNIPKMGRNKLFTFLRDKHILNNKNEPYQCFVDRGYFRQIESKWEHEGTTHINLKTVVFPKGLDYIRALLAKSCVE